MSDDCPPGGMRAILSCLWGANKKGRLRELEPAFLQSRPTKVGRLLHFDSVHWTFIDALAAVDAFITNFGFAVVHGDSINGAGFDTVFATGAGIFVNYCRHFSYSSGFYFFSYCSNKPGVWRDLNSGCAGQGCPCYKRPASSELTVVYACADVLIYSNARDVIK